MRPAVAAFDAIAPIFDERFGAWLSVAAQRRAVRAALLQEFPRGGHILELGGGTGEDASFLAGAGYDVLLTDPSPTMVGLANAKLSLFGARAEVATGEELEDFATRHLSGGGKQFDGAFSNFAPLNCVVDLKPVARGLARLLKPGAPAMLVIFGTFCPWRNADRSPSQATKSGAATLPTWSLFSSPGEARIPNCVPSPRGTHAGS
jgi:SAM-dependent methyltransferase